MNDLPDAAPGDGICSASPAGTVCTLRAAIMEANALRSSDIINLQANATYVLTRVGFDATAQNGDLDILDDVNIVGAGPASTVVDGNGLVTGDRVLQIAAGRVVGISGITVRNGRGTLQGTGIDNSGTLTLTNVTVANNFGSAECGGGISTNGPLSLFNCTIRDNTVLGSSPFPYGGGVCVRDTTATIRDSTISGNSSQLGGGIYAYMSTVRLVNSTVSGNGSRISGGGVYSELSTTSLHNATIADNVANVDADPVGTGGGVVHGGGSVILSNSIVSGNLKGNDGSAFLTPDDCGGTLASTGNNIVTAVVAARCIINGVASSAVPSLGPLQNNGGPTLTHALPPGSAAVNAGNPVNCTDNLGLPITTDQRGEPRPFGPVCDLGAYELGSPIFKDGFES